MSNLHILLVAMQSVSATMENNLVVPQKVKTPYAKLPYDPAILLLWLYAEELKAGVEALLFRAALFMVAKRWGQPKCPSTDEWTDKKGSTQTVEYYSAVKRNKALAHVTV